MRAPRDVPTSVARDPVGDSIAATRSEGLRRFAGDGACLAAIVVAAASFWIARVNHAEVAYNVAGGDAFGYVLPAYDYEARRIAHGELPLWNPYQGTGVPFVGVLQTGALYPARLLLLLTSPQRAMGWSAFGHVLLATIGTYLLCRRLRADHAAAVLGAIVFATAFALPWMLSPALLEPGAWLPALALMVVEILSGGGWAWVLALAAAGAMPLLAGSGQAAVYSAYALAIVALAVVLDMRARGHTLAWRAIGRLMLAAVLAACTAAPQLLPGAAWGTESMRPTYALTDLQMMPLMTDTARHQQIAAFFVRHAPSDLCHLSIPVIALAAIGVVAAGPVALVLGSVALATALLAVAPPGSVAFAIYRSIPGFAMFRFPTRILLVTALFTAIAAALGATRLAEGRGRATGRRRLVVDVAALGIVVLVLVVPYRAIGLTPWSAGPLYSAPDPRFFPAAERPPDAYRVWAPAGRLDLRIGAFVRQGMRWGVRVVQDYEPASARRLGAFLNVAAGRSATAGDDLVLFTGALLDDPPIARPAMLDAVSARSVMMLDAAAPSRPVPGWTQIARRSRYVVYRNHRALPRAYLVSRARVVATEGDALDAVADPAFDPHTEVVLVGGGTTSDAIGLADAPPVPAIPATLAIDEPERVAIDVAPSRPSVLVLTDAFSAGWSVRVDGVPRTLRQANYLVRGVRIAPGDRRVEFRYAAPGFAAGLLIALVAWTTTAVACAAAIWHKGAWRRRRGRGPRPRNGSAASS